MFDLVKYIKEKMVKCVKKGIFDTDYAGIMAVNYLAKGLLTKEDVASIDAQISAWEQEQSAKEEIVEDILTEEVTEPTEDTGETESVENETVSEENEPENAESETEITENNTESDETETAE